MQVQQFYKRKLKQKCDLSLKPKPTYIIERSTLDHIKIKIPFWPKTSEEGKDKGQAAWEKVFTHPASDQRLTVQQCQLPRRNFVLRSADLYHQEIL